MEAVFFLMGAGKATAQEPNQRDRMGFGHGLLLVLLMVHQGAQPENEKTSVAYFLCSRICFHAEAKPHH